MKIGIIGAGNIARTMAETLNQMEDASLWAISSGDEKKAKDFAVRWGAERAYGSYEELVRDDEVELVYIATPHSAHYANAKLCIENGKPVLCEKAFMGNAAQAEEVIALAEEKKVFVTEAIWTRYLPSRERINRIIDSGEIGEVTGLTANLGYNIREKKRITDPALAGGALLDVGIYPLTFASMVLGNEIEQVVTSCVKFDTGVDAQNSVILRYKNGTMASVQSSALSATEQNGIVYGTKGYLIAEHINNVKAVRVYSPDGQMIREEIMPEQITGFEYQVRAAMKAIREGKLECEQIPHRESIFMMKLMDRLRKEWGVKYPFD